MTKRQQPDLTPIRTGSASCQTEADRAVAIPFRPPRRGNAGDAIRLFPIALQRTREALTAVFRPVFARHGISDAQWRVMCVLFNSPDTNAGEIARRAFLLGPSLSRVIRDLEESGLVARRKGTDARQIHHRLTRAGAALIEVVSPELGVILEDLEARMGDAFLNTMNQMLLQALTVLEAVPPAAPQDGNRPSDE